MADHLTSITIAALLAMDPTKMLTVPLDNLGIMHMRWEPEAIIECDDPTTIDITIDERSITIRCIDRRPPTS
jgi:hypothetical protein